tara:strand:+ start:3006 stop:4646 length:1641 start_codon:yes stop_codon:yes gene_type:complete
MAITLVGTVETTADTAGDFSTVNGGANISTDDDFVQGTGAIGDKMSNTTEILASDNLTSTTLAFQSGGANDGDHIIGWINTRTPIDATTGITYYLGDGTNSGTYNVFPSSFYKGGFTTRVIDPARNMDSASGWSTTGNPAQLTAVSQLGFQFTTTTAIMGNFNNCQIDQVTVGQGVRADAGTVGSPNNWESIRTTDEDTNFWGWWSSSNGAFVGKGKAFIGPATGTATSVFSDTAFAINWADEKVAVGFYEIAVRGTNTTCDWSLANIQAANPTTARWSITIDSTTGSFVDDVGTYIGSDIITLNANSTLGGTTFINGNSLLQNSATLASINVVSANTTSGVAYITSNNPGLISGGSFDNTNGVGHAIEITAPGTYSFASNVFTGYGADDTNDAAIYNNSGGLVTLNVTGVSSGITVRNGAGASTTVVQTVEFTVSNIIPNTEIRFIDAAVSPPVSLGGIEDVLAASEPAPDSTTGYTVSASLADTNNPGNRTVKLSYSYSVDKPIFVVCHNLEYEFFRQNVTLGSTNNTFQIAQTFDRQYDFGSQ